MVIEKFKRILARRRFERTLTAWQTVFYNSKANGAVYLGDDRPEVARKWPEGWLTKRRKELENAERS